jgi:O-antigen ligase
LSPEVAELFKNRERVLEQDKSWLVRKTQIDKGIDLFKKYPLSGVGWGHFRYVRADLDIRQYKYLHRAYDDYALTRSSHNSYIQVLAETGVLGFVPFITIQIYIVWLVLKSFVWSRSVNVVCTIGASLLGIAIYFWTVSTVTGAVWYFVMGLFAGAVVDEQRKVKFRFLLSHSRPKTRKHPVYGRIPRMFS